MQLLENFLFSKNPVTFSISTVFFRCKLFCVLSEPWLKKNTKQKLMTCLFRVNIVYEETLAKACLQICMLIRFVLKRYITILTYITVTQRARYIPAIKFLVIVYNFSADMKQLFQYCSLLISVGMYLSIFLKNWYSQIVTAVQCLWESKHACLS